MTHTNNRWQTWMAVALAVVSSVALGHADDWYQFLGPNRNGTSDETRLAESFPASGPKILWREPLGVGMSGVVVGNGAAFTLSQDDAKQYVVCLDAASGVQRWKTPVAPAYENAMGNGPRATPTLTGKHAFVLTGEGILAALEARTGKLLWSQNCPKLLGGKPAEYGMASSPLIVNDVVVIQSAGRGSSVAAFDIRTGDLRWKSGRGAAGYSSPIVTTVNKKRQVIAYTASGAAGIDPENGEQLWSYPFETDYDCNTATPVVLKAAQILISSGENHGSTILNISNSSRPEVEWESLGRTSQLRSEWQTPVVVDGHLYGMDNIGSAGPITNLVCLNLADMSTAWKENRFGKSNLTAADGKLFISTMKGELVIVKATPDAFTETARASVLGMTRQAPVIANGRLYLRDDKEVVCINIRK